MQLRKLLSEDASSFRDIRLRGLRECPSAFSSSYEEEVETPLQTIEGRLGLNKNGSVIGCIINNRVVGVVGIQREAHRKLSHKAIIWEWHLLKPYSATDVHAFAHDGGPQRAAS